ncbi:MAG: hypothetical protein K8S98_16770 [Planctomycetes bacterium]|nr:hypothetical protein [Planctomycetota bacterium]
MPPSSPTDLNLPAGDGVLGADGKRLPGLRDPVLWLVLALAAVVLSVAWYRERGPQIADPIEYMERAHALAYGEDLIDSQRIRAFGFSVFLLPIFGVARLLHTRDFTHAMQACQLFQILLSLALVALTARLTARVAGRGAGLAAAVIVALNPILLRWGVEPVSGVASGCFVTLGVAALFDRRTLGSGIVAGVWLGLGILMAYQTFPLVGVIVAFIALRDLRAARMHTVGLIAGVLAVIFLQCVLDSFYYDSFGVSVTTYLYQNFGNHFATLVYEVGQRLHSDVLINWSKRLYNEFVRLDTLEVARRVNAENVQEQVHGTLSELKRSSKWSWYLQNITTGVPWAALCFVVLGVVRTFFLRSWKAWFAAAVVVLTIAMYGVKASKDFRLWLPFLPLVALLGGVGWSALAGTARRNTLLGFGRVLAALALLCAAGWRGVRDNLDTNVRKFGGYWDAIDWVNRRTRETYATKPVPQGADEAPRETVSAAYHWAVFLRAGSAVDLKKLPHHLDYWAYYSPEERAKDLEAIEGLDWFIAHLPVLTLIPDVMEVVNRDFAVEAVFYDRNEYEDLGPIYVLKKRTGARDERRFYDVVADRSAEDFTRERGLDPERAVHWCEDTADGRVTRLSLLDWKYESVPGDGFGWITYTWAGGGFGSRDYWFVDHLTDDALDTSWDNEHYPAHGMYPTSKWGEHWILTESYLVIAEDDPFLVAGGPRWFGGEHRRGDLIPTTLWMDVAGLDEKHEPVERLESCDARGDFTGQRALRGRPPLPRGECIGVKGWTRVGRLWIPVHPHARYPDDGTPVPAVR